LPNDQTKQYSTDTQINHDFSHDKSHGYYTLAYKMKNLFFTPDYDAEYIRTLSDENERNGRKAKLRKTIRGTLISSSIIYVLGILGILFADGTIACIHLVIATMIYSNYQSSCTELKQLLNFEALTKKRS